MLSTYNCKQFIYRCQPHVMRMIDELSLEVYNQYIDGRKVQQLGGNSIKTYRSTIPSMSVIALLDLHLFMKKVTVFFAFAIGGVGNCKLVRVHSYISVYYIWVEFLHCLLAAHTLINCISRAMVHEYANLEVM